MPLACSVVASRVAFTTKAGVLQPCCSIASVAAATRPAATRAVVLAVGMPSSKARSSEARRCSESMLKAYLAACTAGHRLATELPTSVPKTTMVEAGAGAQRITKHIAGQRAVAMRRVITVVVVATEASKRQPSSEPGVEFRQFPSLLIRSKQPMGPPVVDWQYQ